MRDKNRIRFLADTDKKVRGEKKKIISFVVKNKQ